MTEPGRPLRVVIVCPGLGLSLRGFERVAAGSFEALRERPELDVWLIKGRGRSGDHVLAAPTISRDSLISRKVANRLGEQDFWLEQVVFSLTLQPALYRLRPDVVMLSEWTLAGSLGRLRERTRHRFSILLCNGAGGTPPFPRGVDHVQQVTAPLAEAALAAGFPENRQTVLPHALRIRAHFEPPSASEKRELRRRLGLPVDRRILLTVGALNIWNKRMDYIVREVASLPPEERPFLAMLGAREPETGAVLALATSLLGPSGFTARTVPGNAVADYYRASDAFAFASGFEGFGLVLVEALANGLPILSHDLPASRFVLGDDGHIADFAARGALAGLLAKLSIADDVMTLGTERHRTAYERFSWDHLLPRYAEMLRAVASTIS